MMESRPTVEELRSILADVEKLIGLGVAHAFSQTKATVPSGNITSSGTTNELADTIAKDVAQAVKKAELLQEAAKKAFDPPSSSSSDKTAADADKDVANLEHALKPVTQYFLATQSERLPKVVELLRESETRFDSLYQQALQQQAVQLEIDKIEVQADELRSKVLALHGGLRRTTEVLENALFQADQKLDAMNKGVRTAGTGTGTGNTTNELGVEEIIRYAHHISIQHSVAAPSDWVAGDQRRPYPTDLDMRAGWLGQVERRMTGDMQLDTSPPMNPATSSMAANAYLSTFSAPHAWRLNQQQQMPTTNEQIHAGATSSVRLNDEDKNDLFGNSETSSPASSTGSEIWEVSLLTDGQ